ncbi:hypothetical protein RB614_10770 [Phytohabitans sp. ZYX-F-186]|uniref:Lipoprotein LpqB beta-propeller domain-containing protein n=1 Tax=Phytohabitans maris TaxID=3071409 RepID=A0ABU0ZF17_9ACTN|nr:hypothetical protein [Phytohabitans sp. ZYX-F-186]MDQ7905004.1 hypothetical protein [Phytohabitans sp. ZYX-F-186]
MSDLRELLSDVAEQARRYDVTDRAVRAARRRARARRYAPVAALAVVALVVGGVWIPLASTRTGDSMVAGPVPWLPEVVAAPAQAPPVLGANQRVGLGSLLYRVRGRPDTILLAQNGRQYTIPDAGDPVALALSPDGRWLLLDVDHRLLMQDLRDGGRRELSTTVPDRISWRWSSDGRWLVLAPALAETTAPAGDHTLRLIDLTAGGPVWSRTLPPGTFVLGVSGSGEIFTVYLGTEPDAPRTGVESLGVLHPSRAARTLPLRRIAGVLRPGEQLNVTPGQVLVDGSHAIMRTWIAQAVGDVTAVSADDVLVVDTGSGAAQRRIELPDPVLRAAPRGRPADPVTDARDLLVTAPEGVLLLHHRLDGTVDLELMDRETGELRLATRRADDRIEDLRPRGYAS